MAVVASSVWVLPSRRLLVRANPNPRDQNMVLASHFANASDTAKSVVPIRNLSAIFPVCWCCVSPARKRSNLYGKSCCNYPNNHYNNY